jgi:GTP-binding protein
VEKDSKTADTMKKAILERLAPMNYMPVIFASVIEKQRIFQVIEKVMQVYETKTQKITTSKLNEVMLPIIERTPPPMLKGKQIKIKYCVLEYRRT